MRLFNFLGPQHWPEKYKSCAGKYQSPIDIEESFVTRVSLAGLKTTGFNTAPKTFNITNNGHTGLCTIFYKNLLLIFHSITNCLKNVFFLQL